MYDSAENMQNRKEIFINMR